MFPITIYTGGAVENGAMGVTYNKPPMASYPAQDDITFHDLKRIIYQLTGINADKNSINVNARWNAGAGESHCFVLLPICDDSMWRMVVDKTLSGGTGWSLVELYVEGVPNSVCTLNDAGEKSLSNMDSAEKEPENPTPISFWREVSPEEDEESEDLTDEESIDFKPHDKSALYVGRSFNSKDDLKRAVMEYHIKQNREIVTEQSSSTRYVVRCMVSSCGWRLYARTQEGNCFRIMTIKGKHVCSNKEEEHGHAIMSSEFISKLILDLIKEKGEACTPKEIQDFVHNKYHCKPTYSKAHRARELAIAHLYGEWKESYVKLAPYLNAIQVANPGTKIEWRSDATDNPKMRLFRGVAWAFAPAIEGFKHCRPVISVDSTILCGRYGGRMFIAVAYDAEDQVLPLAFAVIKDEKDESWSWFMRWLRLEVVGERPVCVISDWHNSILRLLDQPDSGWFTGAGQTFHRYCYRYLCENIRSSYKKDYLVKLVKWVSRQNQPSKFRLGMMRILETNREAYNWLVKVGTRLNEASAYHIWSLCEDGGRRYGIMAINGNNCVFDLFPQIRKLPIAAIVELTFTKSAEAFSRNGEAASKIDVDQQLWSNKVMATLDARIAKMSQQKVVSLQSEGILHDEFEVETGSKVKHLVRLNDDQRNCSCQKPQLTGIPCSHLLAVCAFSSLNADHLVDVGYAASELLATWTPQFHPPGGPEEWPVYAGVAYSPNCLSVKRGRRRKNVWSPSLPAKQKKLSQCGICGQIGHYRDSCPARQLALGSTSES